MGYVYDIGVQPKHLIQIADNTATVPALESDNQLLCKAFPKWSSWAGSIVTVDKRSVFRMKKSKTDSGQYQPCDNQP